MPFQGVVHANARRVIAAVIPHLPTSTHVLCSGNFSIEATLRLNGYAGKLTGSDVSLYTCALGAYFVGQDMPLAMNVELFPEFEELEPYLADQEGRAAVVALALDMLVVYRRKNLYAPRMFGYYQRHLGRMVEATKAKLKKRKEVLRLDEFHAQDAWVRAMEIPAGPEHAVMTFPPTYEAGYEKLYKAMDALFSWDAPEYKILTTGAEFAARVIEREGPWIYGTEKRDEALDLLLGKPFAHAPRDSQVSIALYSNLGPSPKVLRRQVSAEEPPWPRLTDEQDLTPESVLSVHRVKSTQANYIRQVYASVEIGQAAAQYSYAVAVDGRCIGVLLFQEPTFGMKIEGETRRDETMYMMADIAVASVRYPRISKLLLLAALSKELRHDLESRCVREVGYVVTTAFSRNPSSMKYRGLFHLLTRKRQPDGVYALNYYGHAGKLTLSEGFALWRTKYGNASGLAGGSAGGGGLLLSASTEEGFGDDGASG